MTFLKTGVLVAALTGAAGVGATVSPVADGQVRAKVVQPAKVAKVQILGSGGGRIGVTVSDLDTTETKTTGGVRVESVQEDSPAAKAGLQTGDIIVEFDGERVRSVRQFSRLVSETPPGRQVAAAVTRDGKRTSLNVTPRESSGFQVFSDDAWRAVDEAREMAKIAPTRPAPVPPRPPSAPRPPRAIEPFVWFGGSQLGVSVNSLSDQLKAYFGVKDGVLVTSVNENSVAAKAGVKAGDIIVSVNGSTVDDPGELREEIGDVTPGEEFTLEIVRDKKPMTLKGKTEETRSRRSTNRVIL